MNEIFLLCPSRTFNAYGSSTHTGLGDIMPWSYGKYWFTELHGFSKCRCLSLNNLFFKSLLLISLGISSGNSLWEAAELAMADTSFPKS